MKERLGGQGRERPSSIRHLLAVQRVQVAVDRLDLVLPIAVSLDVLAKRGQISRALTSNPIVTRFAMDSRAEYDGLPWQLEFLAWVSLVTLVSLLGETYSYNLQVKGLFALL